MIASYLNTSRRSLIFTFLFTSLFLITLVSALEDPFNIQRGAYSAKTPAQTNFLSQLISGINSASNLPKNQTIFPAAGAGAVIATGAAYSYAKRKRKYGGSGYGQPVKGANQSQSSTADTARDVEALGLGTVAAYDVWWKKSRLLRSIFSVFKSDHSTGAHVGSFVIKLDKAATSGSQVGKGAHLVIGRKHIFETSKYLGWIPKVGNKIITFFEKHPKLVSTLGKIGKIGGTILAWTPVGMDVYNYFCNKKAYEAAGGHANLVYDTVVAGLITASFVPGPHAPFTAIAAAALTLGRIAYDNRGWISKQISKMARAVKENPSVLLYATPFAPVKFVMDSQKKASAAVNYVKDKASKTVRSVSRRARSFARKVGRTVKKISRGIRSGISRVAKRVSKTVRSVSRKVKSFARKVRRGVSRVAKGVSRAAKSIAKSVGGFFKGLFGGRKSRNTRSYSRSRNRCSSRFSSRRSSRRSSWSRSRSRYHSRSRSRSGSRRSGYRSRSRSRSRSRRRRR